MKVIVFLFFFFCTCFKLLSQSVSTENKIAILEEVLALDSVQNEFAEIILSKIKKETLLHVDTDPDPSGLSDYLAGLSKKDRKQDTLFTKQEVAHLKTQAEANQTFSWTGHQPGNWDLKGYDNAREAIFSEVNRKSFSLEDAWGSFQTSYGKTYIDFSVPLVFRDGRHAVVGITYRCGPLCDQKGLFLLQKTSDGWAVADCLTFLVGTAY
ncbi:MAG: hypothetical protein ACFB10_13950 [Salibacteraceae bacterium]